MKLTFDTHGPGLGCPSGLLPVHVPVLLLGLVIHFRMVLEPLSHLILLGICDPHQPLLVPPVGLAVLGGLVQIVCVLWLGGLGGCILGSDTDA